MRFVYFSPHLDDGVLSAGGLIRRQVDEGAEVEIWTFMAGIPEDQEPSPYAKVQHQMWGFDGARQAVETRRKEDLQAAHEVGARAVHFEFLDCIYRRDRLGQPLYSEVFVPMQPEEADLPAQIAQTMIAWLRPDDTVVCLLGIGGHVDHAIVRKAALLLRRPLTYIADMPYLLEHPDELEPYTIGLHAQFEAVSEARYKCWIAAIERYASQMNAVFGSHSAMLQSMGAFWQAERGVRLWTKATN